MTSNRMTLSFLCLLLSGCAAMSPMADREARVAFETLEHRMFELPLSLDYEVEAEGALAARLHGRLRRDNPSVIALDARGMFAEAPANLWLRSNSDTLSWGTGPQVYGDVAPPELDDAVLLGFTRMGILHNLAMLAGGRPPDHAAGGVREWLEITEISLADDPDPEIDVLSFSIVVDGITRARAALWVDKASGLPVRRRQTVEFPDSTMTVVERYMFR